MTLPEQNAFPELHIHHFQNEDKEGQHDNVVPRWHGGLSKRELFAVMAMQGLLANPIYASGGVKINGATMTMDQAAIFLADALIETLNKETK
jgi:hypothetical protein